MKGNKLIGYIEEMVLKKGIEYMSEIMKGKR